MRLFVSLRPSRDALAHLGAALAGHRTGRPEQWHVTLAFLGEVARPEVLYDGLRTAAAGTPSFELHLAGSGTFDRARVVWAGVAGDLDRLGALAAQVQQSCREAGVPLERRRFRPHLTIGKTGRVGPRLLAGYRGPAWVVDEIELVHSVLGRDVTHTVLERFPLYQA
jgi:2'-5' RNA ligase